MIRIADQIPNIKSMHKSGPHTVWKDTHDLFKDKKILLFSVPGPFVVEYAASQLRTYEFCYEKFKPLGIDEIWVTSVDDTYVQRAWLKSEGISKIQALPDPAGEWASAIGMLEDMTREGLGKHRSHRYAMIIDNLICKIVKYEDFTHNPMTCFQVTDANTMMTYLENIKTTYERWNDAARDKIDATGKLK
jgi:peroxiredoxin